jgi:hypothetical protein
LITVFSSVDAAASVCAACSVPEDALSSELLLDPHPANMVTAIAAVSKTLKTLFFIIFLLFVK